MRLVFLKNATKLYKMQKNPKKIKIPLKFGIIGVLLKQYL